MNRIKAEHQLHCNNELQYGVKLQLTDPIDTTAPLMASQNTLLQKITGKFLYYARAVDPTMLVTLRALASQQTKGTEQTMDDAIKFLNYCTTHPNATIRYKALDMILQVHSDASYLSESKACSRAGGLFYMGSDDIGNDTLNSAILASTSIMKPILSSARKLQYSILHSWPQPATPIQTNNSTAYGIANNNIKLQQSQPWICVSTGCVIAAKRDIFIFSGNQGPPTLLTTSRNIMQHNTIYSCDLCICMNTRR
jgi:hypothetical protein